MSEMLLQSELTDLQELSVLVALRVARTRSFNASSLLTAPHG